MEVTGLEGEWEYAVDARVDPRIYHLAAVFRGTLLCGIDRVVFDGETEAEKAPPPLEALVPSGTHPCEWPRATVCAHCAWAVQQRRRPPRT